jgi:transmembrane sensor
MTSRVTSLVEEQAIQWLIRTRDPAFGDWEGLTAWLEADPERARLFDQLSAADAEIADHIAATPAAPVRHARWPVWGGAIAAALAFVALLFPLLHTPGFAPQTIASLPGQKLSVRLADGSRIDMNGGTRLILDGPRHARLERGEALFAVVHDDARPFEVVSGSAVVRDVGTTFNLVREPQTFTATVSEGEIIFNPDREAVRVPAGRQVQETGEQVLVTIVDPAQVGTWRQGRLIYRGARLERVAADLSRGLGMPVAADDSVSARPFSGIIQIEGRGENALRSAALILGVDVRRAGDHWLLTAP